LTYKILKNKHARTVLTYTLIIKFAKITYISYLFKFASGLTMYIETFKSSCPPDAQKKKKKKVKLTVNTGQVFSGEIYYH